jgi:hypothetical protein
LHQYVNPSEKWTKTGFYWSLSMYLKSNSLAA